MTNLINFKEAVKNDFIKFMSIVIVVVLMGYGIVSFATEDTKPATVNFSVLGIVSDISVDNLEIEEAKGSDRSGKTTYNLNIENLTKLETDKNIPINFIDIKVGDKIIAQGLTNGSTFFIKRIISFTSIPTEVATTTDEVVTTVATSTAISTDDILATTTEDVLASSTDKAVDLSIPILTLLENSTSTEIVNTSTTTDETVSISTLIDNSTSTEVINTSTTTDESPATTTSVIETVTNVVEEIINTVSDTINDAIDTLAGNNDQATTTENPPTSN